jgi:hypothetical protein
LFSHKKCYPSFITTNPSFTKACYYFNTTYFTIFKGIVQRDLWVVETRPKRSPLLSYRDAKFSFLILKGHHHEKSIKLVYAF